MKHKLSKTMQKKFADGGCTFGHEEGREVARGPDGGYIGITSNDRHFRWLAKYGIFSPLKGSEDGSAAQIGKSTIGKYEGKWVGWSHRAAATFGIGDMIFDEALLASDPKWGKLAFQKVGTIVIKTDDQARQAASNFAGYVS